MKIPGCRLQRSPMCGLICFLTLGVLFLVLGLTQQAEAAALFKADIVYFSQAPNQIKDKSVSNDNFVFTPTGECNWTSQNEIHKDGYNSNEPKWCEISFEIKRELKNVYFQQRFDNFWQNNRIQMNNRSQTQLDGYNPQWQIDGAANSAIKACLPLVNVEKFKNKQSIDKLYSVNGTELSKNDTMVPCGQSAASQFNIDQFELLDGDNQKVDWNTKDIIWEGFTDNGKQTNSTENLPKGGEWRDIQWTDIHSPAFIEWMNPSSIKTQKVYAKIDKLPKGNYTLKVRNTWELTKYVASDKHFIISEENALGEKDNPMPTILIICGILALLSAAPAYWGAKKSAARSSKEN